MNFLLIILLCLYLSGCKFLPEEEPHIPKFSFGTKVYVTDGFYKGCYGNVASYNLTKEGIVYTLNADCPVKGKNYLESKVLDVSEDLLVEDIE